MDNSAGICFTVNQDLKKAVEEAAEKKGLGVAELVAGIVAQYVEDHTAPAGKKDKRRFRRSMADVPVVLQIQIGQNEVHYRTGKILDISMGGVRISLPKHERLEDFLSNENIRIEVFFTLPKDQAALIFEGEPSFLQSAESDLTLGVRFTNTDFQSSQKLHKYVM